jgi:hypothetical protein
VPSAGAGPFFGYFLLDQSKKVTRLPAGTGDLELRFFMYKAMTNLLEPAGRVPPDALLFASRQKVSKNRLLLRRALLVRSFFSIYSHWIYRPEHYTSAPFTGPLPLAPTLHCSAVVPEECFFDLAVCSDPVSFQPMQETTALNLNGHETLVDDYEF